VLDYYEVPCWVPGWYSLKNRHGGEEAWGEQGDGSLFWFVTDHQSGVGHGFLNGDGYSPDMADWI
jgi:hypothetical protein